VTPREHDDETIRAAIAELRAADERHAPSFEAVLTRRDARMSRGHMPDIARLALAAVLVLAVGAVYRGLAARPARITVPSEVIALSAWRPATDMLLETPGRDLLKAAPQLGASLLDTNTPGDFR